MSFKFESVYFDNPIVPGRAMDIFLPEVLSQDDAIFFVHGGGWAAGARDHFHKLMRAFNAEGFICASTDYRLRPSGATILDQVADIRDGYKLFLERLAELGRPPRAFVIGSSAGAHLAALLAFAAPGACGEPTDYRPDIAWVPPSGAALQATPVSFEPWEDIFPHGWTSMREIVGAPYETAPELYRKVSPREHLSPHTCPTFFLEAENEHMFPSSMVIEVVEKLKALGVQAEYKVYTKAEHGFFYDLTRRQQQEAFADILAFIARRRGA